MFSVGQVNAMTTRALDDGYTGAVERVLGDYREQIVRGSMSGVLNQLNTLSGEDDPNTPLPASIGVLPALLLYGIRQIFARLNAGVVELQRASAQRALQLTNALASEDLGELDVDDLLDSIDLAQTETWAQEQNRISDALVLALSLLLLQGQREGWDAQRYATEITTFMALRVPREIEAFLRTVWLTTARRAQNALLVARADRVAYYIRVATLDTRTCLACVALHGSRLEVGDALNDHYRGRCVAVPVMRGDADPEYQTGEAWFAGLSPERQQQQATFARNPAYWRAYQAGAVRLGDFAQHIAHPLFGDMLREASLKGILGDAARRYYTR